MKNNLYRGEWISDDDLENKIDSIAEQAAVDLAVRMDMDKLLLSCDLLARELEDRNSREYCDSLVQGGCSEKEAWATLQTIADFLRRENLEQKLEKEFGTLFPFELKRVDFREDIFEGFAPVGVLVHIVPGNSPAVAPLSIIEGLLSGNINILKNSSKNSNFSQILLHRLAEVSPGGFLKPFIYAFQLSSKNTALLRKLFNITDAISVWGSEESVNAVKSTAPPNVKIIEWGHRISFSYITRDFIRDEATLKRVAKDICIVSQQACSSPQCLYLETADREELNTFARSFAGILDKVSHEYPFPEPTIQEWAEISTVKELAKVGNCLDESDAIEAGDKQWRVLIDYKSGLRPSPLYRTIWLKPIGRENIVRLMRPLRPYLQTVGLACLSSDLAELTENFIQAGITRIRRPGEMIESYSGEPHDGVYALRRYSRKVSSHPGAVAEGIATFDDFVVKDFHVDASKKIMSFEDFVGQRLEPRYRELFFKSGGSSGKPKISTYSYRDYHLQMEAAAEGLYAAGLDPKTDIVMNLFFSGNLYGSFISFWTILEFMRAKQLPVTGIDEHQIVAETIVQNKVNTIMSLPIYINLLFSRAHDLLKEYRGIKKIFYAGEHLSKTNAEYLKNEFGVELIRSATYGSNDAGPLGYACPHCEGGVHHLLDKTQHLEIFKLDSAEPVEGDEGGRLLFTSKYRQGQELIRYEIGDMGKWVYGACPCGRTSPRFELLGKYGDLFKMVVNFNYRDFVRILDERARYTGEVQLMMENVKGKHSLTVFLNDECALDEARVKQALFQGNHHLDNVVNEMNLASFHVQFISVDDFEKIPSSGKLRIIIDKR